MKQPSIVIYTIKLITITKNMNDQHTPLITSAVVLGILLIILGVIFIASSSEGFFIKKDSTALCLQCALLFYSALTKHLRYHSGGSSNL
jgi:multisubunit Na+/H+ antiporter MnhG subunit